MTIVMLFMILNLQMQTIWKSVSSSLLPGTQILRP
ncbi:UNVERIFIED_CONTAM: hypothetical protein GTU68_012256 [Idotea baltica]|nr:hypothetical protein [Idotea baltica]